MLKLYYDLMSQPSRALFLFLKKTSIPFQKCLVDIKSGGHKEEEYTLVHPFQQLPAIDDNGFKLFESVGIVRYLCRQYSDTVADHWYPQDSKKQAKIDQYLEWQHANIRFHCAMYFQHKFLIPKMTGQPPKQTSLDRFRQGSEIALERMETYWIKDKKFIGGEEISVADIFALCEIDQLKVTDLDPYKERPELARWFRDVTRELEPELTETNVILNKLAKLTKSNL